MNAILKKIRNIKGDNCVTIILNTHRTRPENKQDSIVLKNLMTEAEERLLKTDTKRDIRGIVKKMKDMGEKIDHNYNLESLILFINDEVAEFVRLPVPVENRVVIDDNFATRDIVRAMHSSANYYILLLSRETARLIEAFNDKVIEEVGGDFPVKNDKFYTTSGIEASNATRSDNLMKEFFNRIDKAVNNHRKNNPLPVLICTEESNYYEYIKIADERSSIFETFLNGNKLDGSALSVVAEGWKIVEKISRDINLERKTELQKAVSANNFLSDTNEIYQAIKNGRVKTLFVEEGLFQPALLKDGKIVYVTKEEMVAHKEVIDDIYDELIEENMKFGGQTVFLPKGELPRFNGFGAITRY